MNSEHSWFNESRFGIFIHWGVYALPARHEWVMSNEEMSEKQYEQYADYFEPDLFEPEKWAKDIAASGAKYAVMTAKHHDGFCLWDSALTSYTSMRTACRRDLVREFTDAMRSEGLRVGLYYSLLDWHHPDFTIDGNHPQRNRRDARSANEDRDMGRYRAYLHGQVEELLSDYGVIDYLFFDYSYVDPAHAHIWGGKGADDWGSDELVSLVRRLQPHTLINDRLDVSGDVLTPEQYQPSSDMVAGADVLGWEACQTFNGSWGYDRDNHDLKSPELLIRMLVDGVAKNGNMLLNVGPTGRGELGEYASHAFQQIGWWLRRHGRAIYGAGPSQFQPPTDVRYTQRGRRLYAHLFSWPFRDLHLPGLASHVIYAQLLNDGSEVKIKDIPQNAVAYTVAAGAQPPGTLTMELPVVPPEVPVPVIEMFLNDGA